ncbi:hypothetical protein ACG7TL_005478 [Trametes sanguinea]
MADAASTAASASAATATSESDTNTPTPASPVKPTPATAQVTASPCPEPMYRPVKASSVLPLDYLASSQTQWEVVVVPLPRAPEALTLIPAPATFNACDRQRRTGVLLASEFGQVPEKDEDGDRKWLAHETQESREMGMNVDCSRSLKVPLVRAPMIVE